MSAEHRCDTGNFDRTICPEPCGMMHSYCGTCGERQDTCAHDQHPMTLTTKDAETLAEALRKCRVEDGSPAPLFHEGDLMHIAHVLIASGVVRREAEDVTHWRRRALFAEEAIRRAMRLYHAAVREGLTLQPTAVRDALAPQVIEPALAEEGDR